MTLMERLCYHYLLRFLGSLEVLIMFLGPCSEVPLPPVPPLVAALLAPLPPPFVLVLPLFLRRGSLAAFTMFPWLESLW